MIINGITLYGSQIVDYMAVYSDDNNTVSYTTTVIQKDDDKIITKEPSWYVDRTIEDGDPNEYIANHMQVLCHFDSIEKTEDNYGVDLNSRFFIDFEELHVHRFDVYRRKIGESTLHLVKRDLDYDQLNLFDYCVQNNADYQWFIYPIVSADAAKALGYPYSFVAPFRTTLEQGHSDFEEWSVTFVEPDKDNDKILYPTRIWTFICNVKGNALTQNFDKTQFQNYTRYPKIAIGTKNYITTQCEMLLADLKDGTLEDEAEFNDAKYWGAPYPYYEPVALWEEWTDCVASGRECILKDTKGHMMRGQITSNQGTPLSMSFPDPPTIISFQFVETGTLNGYQIIDRDEPIKE